jgi:hypothetical protein
MSENLPIVVEQHQNLLAKYAPPADGASVSYWTTIDSGPVENKQLLGRCWQTADVKGEDIIGQQIRLWQVMMHSIDLEDPDTGETADAVRTVLIDEARKTYGFVSVGVAKSLGMITSLWGLPPWQPPLVVVVRQKSTRKGRRLYVLEVVDREEK